MHASFPPPFESEEEKAETFVEGRDFYFEAGLMVLTRRYLANRGFCCGSDCRHCPYEGDEKRP
ncbi:MAG: DUF5522 domain-containing protein [Pyrinomonadaceae bacterium]